MNKTTDSRWAHFTKRQRGHDDLSQVASAARQGDPLAIRTFMTAIGPTLLRVVRTMLGREQSEVEDLLQDVAIQVIDALPRYQGECSVLHFACRVAVLTAMNARRRELARKRTSLTAIAGDVDALAAAEPEQETRLAARSAMIAVRELLATLPESQAEALALHCVLGYTIEEIACSAKVPLETVRSRLRLAKQALRKRVLGDPVLMEMVEEA